MIRLQLLTEPVEVRWPADREHWVRLKRLDSMDLNEARQRALKVLRTAGDFYEAMAPFGLDTADSEGNRLNPKDEGQMFRVGALVEHVEVCLKAVEAWGGFDGETPPIDRRSLATVLKDDAYAAWLVGEVTKAARILISEKKGSAPSPNGPAVGAKTGSTPSSAETASGSGSPALKAAAPRARSSSPASSANGPA